MIQYGSLYVRTFSNKITVLLSLIIKLAIFLWYHLIPSPKLKNTNWLQNVFIGLFESRCKQGFHFDLIISLSSFFKRWILKVFYAKMSISQWIYKEKVGNTYTGLLFGEEILSHATTWMKLKDKFIGSYGFQGLVEGRNEKSFQEPSFRFLRWKTSRDLLHSCANTLNTSKRYN